MPASVVVHLFLPSLASRWESNDVYCLLSIKLGVKELSQFCFSRVTLMLAVFFYNFVQKVDNNFSKYLLKLVIKVEFNSLSYEYKQNTPSKSD